MQKLGTGETVRVPSEYCPRTKPMPPVRPCLVRQCLVKYAVQKWSQVSDAQLVRVLAPLPIRFAGVADPRFRRFGRVMSVFPPAGQVRNRGNFPPANFSKTCLVVRHNIKLQLFCHHREYQLAADLRRGLSGAEEMLMDNVLFLQETKQLYGLLKTFCSWMGGVEFRTTLH